MPEIIDVIFHKTKSNPPFTQVFVVLDKLPEFRYERKGQYLIAEHDGFFSSYVYDTPGENWKAFAGRKFDIPMKDGTVEKAYGQWWSGGHELNAPYEISHIGANTLEHLHNCYVFCSYCIKKEKLDKWLAENKPADDYEKYRKHNKLQHVAELEAHHEA